MKLQDIVNYMYIQCCKPTEALAVELSFAGLTPLHYAASEGNYRAVQAHGTAFDDCI